MSGPRERCANCGQARAPLPVCPTTGGACDWHEATAQGTTNAQHVTRKAWAKAAAIAKGLRAGAFRRLRSTVARSSLRLLDQAEATLDACAHPYAHDAHEGAGWCNVCGARQLTANGPWLKPHWRDRLAKALL